MNKHFFLVFAVFLLIIGCAPQRSNPVNAAYHDLTAKFNAYFIANENIKAVEQSLFDGYSWNYDKILPIYVPFDSTVALGFKDLTEDCIKKASICIQRHPDAKWEYPAYILVGKARLYNLEFADAVEAFKYVNTKSDDDDVRHEALAHLIRTFTMNQEYNNAQAVVDFLAKEELSNKNKEIFYLNQAYLHQESGNLNLMVQNLVEAEELFSNAKDRARIQFIVGQVYEKLGFDALAFHYYEKSLKNNPTYELSFYTKLNMAGVTQLSEGKDVKTIRKYFKKLLVDRKNFEYNDKIYYEMGQFELKNGNMDVALQHFKTSVKVSQNNNRQKGLSYLSLARVHYDSLKNFEMAKLYYDSTVTSLPKDEDNYSAIKERQEILTDFVKHITTIRKNDSLLSLSNLPPDSLRAFATQLVNQDSITEAESKKAQEKLARTQNQAPRDQFTSDDDDIIPTNIDGNWYFNNPTVVSKGYTKFMRSWKNRPLEDHWRRSNKIASTSESISENTDKDDPEEEQSVSKNADKPKSGKEKIDALIAQVPSTEEAKEKLRKEIADALYAVGNIYNFRLSEKPNAIATFNDLLNRFPGSEYEPEVLYQLYLLQKEDDPTKSQQAAKRLTSEYPETIYAKLIVNPNFREESFAATIELQSIYKNAYQYFENGEYEKSKELLDEAIARHPENEFTDNLALLRAMNIGQLEGQHLYQFELDNFLKSYPESELIGHVNGLIETSEEYKINLYSSSKAAYVTSAEQSHYFVFIYKSSQENGRIATKMVGDYLEENLPDKKYGNVLLSENHSMVVISNIDEKSKAIALVNEFSDSMNPFEKMKGQEYFIFAISEENFETLYQTKDIESYKTFFERNYL